MNKSEIINEVIILIKQLIYDYIAQSVYIVKWKNVVKGIVLDRAAHDQLTIPLYKPCGSIFVCQVRSV